MERYKMAEVGVANGPPSGTLPGTWLITRAVYLQTRYFSYLIMHITENVFLVTISQL